MTEWLKEPREPRKHWKQSASERRNVDVVVNTNDIKDDILSGALNRIIDKESNFLWSIEQCYFRVLWTSFVYGHFR